MDLKSSIYKALDAHLQMVEVLRTDERLVGVLEETSEAIASVLQAGGKVLFCGNGGSAADAQHLAAELSGRFYKQRKALFAEALHVNTSFLTAVANDYGFEEVFARAVEAQGKRGDVLVALSTSGTSPNVLRACEKAKDLGLKVIGLSGANGGNMKPLCDWFIQVPSTDTARIQEGHLLIGHLLCQLVEQRLFS